MRCDSSDRNDALTLRNMQEKVDNWIREIGGGYFSELTNIALLAEETGELARVIARIYGDQKAKAGDLKENPRENLSEEMADVLWVLACLANQTGIDLERAFGQTLRKKTLRDSGRFK